MKRVYVTSHEIAANNMIMSPSEIAKRKKEGTWVVPKAGNEEAIRVYIEKEKNGYRMFVYEKSQTAKFDWALEHQLFKDTKQQVQEELLELKERGKVKEIEKRLIEAGIVQEEEGYVVDVFELGEERDETMTSSPFASREQADQYLKELGEKHTVFRFDQ